MKSFKEIHLEALKKIDDKKQIINNLFIEITEKIPNMDISVEQKNILLQHELNKYLQLTNISYIGRIENGKIATLFDKVEKLKSKRISGVEKSVL